MFQQKGPAGTSKVKLTMTTTAGPMIKGKQAKMEVRFLDLDYKAKTDVVQCYHCGTMLPRKLDFRSNFT